MRNFVGYSKMKRAKNFKQLKFIKRPMDDKAPINSQTKKGIKFDYRNSECDNDRFEKSCDFAEYAVRWIHSIDDALIQMCMLQVIVRHQSPSSHFHLHTHTCTTLHFRYREYIFVGSWCCFLLCMVWYWCGALVYLQAMRLDRPQHNIHPFCIWILFDYDYYCTLVCGGR